MVKKELVMRHIRMQFVPGERDPALLVLDSHGSHERIFNENLLSKCNIYSVLVAENLTCILQPLDVPLNKSFHSYYNEMSDKCIAGAIENPALQTKNGNPKVPSCISVANWVLSWKNSVHTSHIQSISQHEGLCTNIKSSIMLYISR